MAPSRAAAIAKALEAWFVQNARDLPWRRRRTGYTALVSELMLQQTQVARVLPAYRSFMRLFPTPARLARASQSQVLAAWQGLGYYRRARLLHGAAKEIVERHSGGVPADVVHLRQLPGVGRYTAGAIASIVHGAREPIVDGNVMRVLARIEASAQAQAPGHAWAWTQAERLVGAASQPGVFNEALMELGATVCTPRTPECSVCPLAHLCKAHAQDRVGEFPRPKAAATRQVIHRHTLVCISARGVLLVQRPESGLWAGMWEPPTVESAEPILAKELHAQWGLRSTRIATFEHTLTHRRVICAVHTPVADLRGTRRGVSTAGSAPAARGRTERWVPIANLSKFALSSAAQRALAEAGVAVSPRPSAGGFRRAVRAVRSAGSGS